MTDLLYCGTHPVGPDDTQAMLAGRFHALWAPPMHRHAAVKSGDRIWLLWRAESGAPWVLGGGFVAATPERKIDWTNRTAPGIVAAAREHGYRGPTNMAFLRVVHVSLPERHIEVAGLGRILIGLSTASPAQAARLQAILPINWER